MVLGQPQPHLRKGKYMNILSVCDGLGAARIALDKAGVGVSTYLSSEIDVSALKVMESNYPCSEQIGDITKVGAYTDSMFGHEGPDFSVFDSFIPSRWLSKGFLIGGTPCTNVSFAGKQEGLKDTQSGLVFEYIRLKNGLQPKWFLLENTRMSQASQDIISEALGGIQPVAINSDLWVPQNRPRLYWTNIPIAPLPERPKWDCQYYQWRRNHYRANKSGVCPCLTANMGTGGHNVPLKSMDKADKLSPEECEVLQGIPEGYTAGVSKSQRLKMIGNSFTVPVVAHILSGMTTTK